MSQEIDHRIPDIQHQTVETDERESGGGQGKFESQRGHAPATITTIIAASRSYHQLMRAEKPLENQVRAYWQMMGKIHDSNIADEREKRFRAAVKLFKREVPDENTVIEVTVARSEFSPTILAIDLHRASLEKYRKTQAKILEAAAKELPVWPWVESVSGIGALGLALIVGAAGGELYPNYANPAKLWKRLGLAVVLGEAQKRRKGEKGRNHGPNIVHDIEECKTCLAMFSGFSPTRRAVMHNCGESLMKQNKLEDGAPAKYRAIYLERKQYEADRDPKMKPGYCHNRALRYMEKAFIKDLWNEWKRCVRSAFR